MNETEFDILRAYAESVFICGSHSIHGAGHWRNVENNFLLIAPGVGADVVVGRVFAILHDCCRCDDGGDLYHGPRAANLIRKLSGSKLVLDSTREDLLVYAVQHHTAGETSDDPTIGACWDADRLDLGRVGIIPSPTLMSTSVGKEIATLGSKFLYLEKRG